MAITSKPKGESTPRPHNAYEAPSKPTRRAREYSVLKTACLALCGRHPFECCLHWRRKSSNANAFSPKRLTGRRHQQPSACRATTRGHRERNQMRKPLSDRSRSCKIVAGARVLGLWTNAQTDYGPTARLPAWKVLAFQRGRDTGVGQASARWSACRLTPALHWEMT
jgi:hypothetical protein